MRKTLVGVVVLAFEGPRGVRTFFRIGARA